VNSAAVPVEAVLSLGVDKGPVEGRCRFCFDETSGCVEGSIPRHVGVGAERDLRVATFASMMLRRLQECSAQASPCTFRRNGDLLQVTDPVDLQDMRETGDATVLQLDY